LKPNTTTSIKDRLVVALDVPDRDSALRLIERLGGLVGMYKVGLQLYTAEGPQFVREIVAAGERVFLDLKFHDIPNTVTGATRSAARLGVSIIDVHCLGGFEMIHAATLGFSDTDIIWITRPAVLAVTVLTSMDQASLNEVGITADVESEVVRLAKLAYDAGLDGVVASPQEISLIRERVAGEPFIILTPGIRPVWSESGDQKRVATPAIAIRDGADFIVIGRAITASPDPRAAAERVIEEINSSL
jgi:orotidine-5'-phosphate decarboxylase